MSSPRQSLGAALWRLSDLVRADERRRSFRAKAYRRAVWSLDDLSPDLTDPPEMMLAVPGIGPGVLRLIEEHRSDGRIAALEQLDRQYPREVAVLRRLPRMTPTLLRSLKGELGVDGRNDLIAAVESGAVESLRGVGSATAERWARTLEMAPSTRSVPAFQAAALAESLRRHLSKHLGGQTWVAGSVRRLDEWVETLDLVSEVGDEAEASRFLEQTAVARHLGHDGEGVAMLESHEGVEVRAHLAVHDEAGAALLEATGPPEHAAALLSGIDAGGLTEPEIYQRSRRVWVPPPARALPTDRAAAVVRLEHIRGDLHLHTDRSPDGRMNLSDVLDEAVDRGYEYLLITDHTSGLRFGGLDAQGLIEQRAEIDQARSRFPGLVVLHGAELNIDRDGGLDVDDETLGLLDMAVAGIHSHFDLDRAEQTARVLSALHHPTVRILAHPTGRRIGIRPPLDLDLEAVIAAAVEHRVALEVNGHRDRLDLSAGLIEMADAAGALLAADSDSHRVGEMGNVANSVATMQRAGLRPASVVNTLPVDDFLDWAAYTT
ncbi:MAG TPA: PHP domain-containing protein, partial [Acidimicrobiia bacterium]|nr:PHP domain-containing protein [Acidimicrobiia bacterium]